MSVSCKTVAVLFIYISGLSTKQTKKLLSWKKQLKLKGWRDDEDSQIQQLLYYMMAVGFKHIISHPCKAT